MTNHNETIVTLQWNMLLSAWHFASDCIFCARPVLNHIIHLWIFNWNFCNENASNELQLGKMSARTNQLLMEIIATFVISEAEYFFLPYLCFKHFPSWFFPEKYEISLAFNNKSINSAHLCAVRTASFVIRYDFLKFPHHCKRSECKLTGFNSFRCFTSKKTCERLRWKAK